MHSLCRCWHCAARAHLAVFPPWPLTPSPLHPTISPRAGGMLSPDTPRFRASACSVPPENPQKTARTNNTTRQNTSTRVPTLSFSDAGEASARPEATHTGLFQAKSCTFSQVWFSFWFIVISQHTAKSLCVARCVCLYISALALQS